MYTIRKSKGSNKYYVVDPGGMAVCNPIDKKKALHLAAEKSGMDYKEYMRRYRNVGSIG